MMKLRLKKGEKPAELLLLQLLKADLGKAKRNGVFGAGRKAELCDAAEADASKEHEVGTRFPHHVLFC